jgi:cystathionine beta-lyase/cystathionine gamma-synthase
MKSALPRDSSFATRLQHAGADQRLGTGLVGALELSVTYQSESVAQPPVYARLSNTRNHAEVEALIASLHGAPRAAVFASGMAAMNAVVFTLLRPGAHILAQENCYGGNAGLLTKVLARWGVETTFAPLSEWPSHLRPETQLAYCESISNPLCVPQDLRTAAGVARAAGVPLLVDNTFASPALCTPLLHGADLVLESGTKYLNGHSDLICGVVAGSTPLIARIAEASALLGGFLSTQGCVQLMRGVRTLGVRMEAHARNAELLARGLKESPLVTEVFHGSVLGPERALPALFPKGHGGMLAVRFRDDIDVEALVRKFALVTDVPSLGGTETTVTMPWFTTNATQTQERRLSQGIDKKLVRVSVGLEDPGDVLADMLGTAKEGVPLLLT